VTLGVGELDTAIAYGVTPVGMTDPGPEGFPSYIDESDVASIATVGPVETPDLAAIAALQPDLILSNVLLHRELYAQLSQVAPTVFGDRVDVAWRLNAELLAVTMGREREASAVNERFKQRLAEVAAALPQPRPRISIVHVMPGTLRIYQRCNFVSQVLTDLGINRPRTQNFDQFAVDTTLDNPSHADGDAIFVAADEQGAAVFNDEMVPSEPWKALSAVQGGRVREVDHRVWLDGQSYGAAFELLKQLLEFYSDDQMRKKG
jgi:iron complex transport system substrate-binding protein